MDWLLVLSVLFVVSFSMLVFSNSLYYAVSLLVVSLIVLLSLSVNLELSVLFFILVMIVYLGAMIILIGYVCAISPNLVISSRLNLWLSLAIISSFVAFALVQDCSPMNVFVSSFTLIDYFYSSHGSVSFLVIVFILFLALLIVTSQYLSPSSPLRSTK